MPLWELNLLLRGSVPWFNHKIKDAIKGLCNNYQEGGGGAEKLELSSKNLDSTPLQNEKN